QDAAKTKAVEPDSLFRLASLSKIITAVAIMKLVDQGKLNLDAGAFALMADVQAPAGATVDPRLKDITMRMMLNLSGGWDRDKRAGGYDPMFLSPTIVNRLGVSAPAPRASFATCIVITYSGVKSASGVIVPVHN